MNSDTIPTLPVPATTTAAPYPGRGRRTALVVTGVLAAALPAVFTVSVSRMLLSGVETDHRFHQLTGQGLVLFALWLAPLAALLRAGWRGRRPAPAWGWCHLAFVTTGAVCAAAATGGGAPYLVGVVAVTGGLVWLTLPNRPRLVSRLRLHPVLAPAALVTTAFYMPYAVDQVQQQNAALSGYHAQNPHLFDMAWLASGVMVLVVLAALLPASRRLATGAGAASAVIGLAGLATGEGTTWSLGALAVGALVLVAGWARDVR
jgi:hypothetical protein